MLSVQAILAGVLILAGLFALSLTPRRSDIDGQSLVTSGNVQICRCRTLSDFISRMIGTGAYALSALNRNQLLVGCGVIGACGTAISLWLFRDLVRVEHASLGSTIALRYSGLALATFLLAKHS